MIKPARDDCMRKFRARMLGSLSSHTYTNAANSSTITPRADFERVDVDCSYRRDQRSQRLLA